MGERQHTSHHPAALSDQIVGAVPERSLDHPPPSAQMEERPAGMG
jgi:hypothetical protein